MVTKSDLMTLDRDVFDLARNVKKEANAIEELNNTLRRNQLSATKERAISTSVDRVGGEEARELKNLKRKIKELEGKVSKYENDLSSLNDKLADKTRKLDEMENYINNTESRYIQKVDNLLNENRDLSNRVINLGMMVKDSKHE